MPAVRPVPSVSIPWLLFRHLGYLENQYLNMLASNTCEHCALAAHLSSYLPKGVLVATLMHVSMALDTVSLLVGRRIFEILAVWQDN